MCTVVILRRSDHRWPILVAANRDEMAGRPWLPPGRHWDDRPNVVAGQDELAGGSWLGINDEGVVAAILNRQGTLGPEEGKRSRGELVLEALDHADAVDAAKALIHLAATAYRPFNMMIADNRDAFWLRSDGQTVRAAPLDDGVSMLTAFDLNDPNDPRIRAYLPKFRDSAIPDPEAGNWGEWKKLLATPAPYASTDREAGLTFQLESGFGTRSSALIALPSVDHPEIEPVFLFAPGPPDQASFRPVVS
ncbi:NRDE family protein [Telmatospirillum sp.]|uniref:NRDE family protein n=1 Tax=Telmatospirillum sp. TaxID=2079197 RepID=UPI00284E706F|nr:NRDE family protein [Telmatospirillum sp.]MDR3437980.1 NRDE family protein [Telmatospirillum sp.]